MSDFSHLLPRGEPCSDELAFCCDGSQPSDDSTATCSSRDEIAALREELASVQQRCAELEAQVASSRGVDTDRDAAGADATGMTATGTCSVRAGIDFGTEQRSPIRIADDDGAASAEGEDVVAEPCPTHADGQDVANNSSTPPAEEDCVAAEDAVKGSVAEIPPTSPASSTAKRNQRRRAAAKKAKALSVASEPKPSSAIVEPKSTPAAKAPRSDPPTKHTSSSMLHKSACCAAAPPGTPVGILTLEQLAEFSGDCPRLLVSVCGNIFDVSSQRERYGPGGLSSWAAGRDATWALLTGVRTPENCNHFYNLEKASESDLNIAASVGGWLSFFHQDHGKPVGKLDVYNHDQDFPLPPPLEEHSPECVVQ